MSFNSKTWLRTNIRPYLKKMKFEIESAIPSLVQFVTLTGNTTLNNSGKYICDVSNGSFTITLPAATGSGETRVIRISGTDKTNGRTLNIRTVVGHKLNGINFNHDISSDRLITIVDVQAGTWMTEEVLHLQEVNLMVPGDFPTIDDALEASYMFTCSTGVIKILLADGTHTLAGDPMSNHPQRIEVSGLARLNYPPVLNGSGSINNFWTGTKNLDKAKALQLGGAIINCTDAVGEAFGYHENSSMDFINCQIHFADTITRNVSNTRKRMTSTFENVMLFGGGQTFNNSDSDMNLYRVWIMHPSAPNAIINNHHTLYMNTVHILTDQNGVLTQRGGSTEVNRLYFRSPTGIPVDTDAGGDTTVYILKCQTSGIAMRGKHSNTRFIVSTVSTDNYRSDIQAGRLFEMEAGTFVADSSNQSGVTCSVSSSSVGYATNKSVVKLGSWITVASVNNPSAIIEMYNDSFTDRNGSNLGVTPAAQGGENGCHWI